MNLQADSQRLDAIMALCYGTEHYYYNKYLSFEYTDGVKMFCDKARAYWLLDVVESVVKTEQRMQFDVISIDLFVKEGNTATITFSDKKGEFYRQTIPYTDCPMGLWSFYYDDGVFLWNGEY